MALSLMPAAAEAAGAYIPNIEAYQNMTVSYYKNGSASFIGRTGGSSTSCIKLVAYAYETTNSYVMPPQPVTVNMRYWVKSGGSIGLLSTIYSSGDSINTNKAKLAGVTNATDIDGCGTLIAVLTSDKKVVSASNKANSAINTAVSSWTNIVSIAVADGVIIGLKKDATCVVACTDGKIDVSAWKGIKAVDCTSDRVIGLKKDGTCVVQGKSGAIDDLSGWKSIASIAASSTEIAGVKTDGTVVNLKGLYPEAKNWTNVAKVSLSPDHIVALHWDGTASSELAPTATDYGQAKVSSIALGTITTAINEDPTDDVVKPDAPAKVKAVSSSYNKIKLTWAASEGAASYAVYRATSSTGKFTKLADVAATTYYNTSLTCGKTYYYKLKATNKAGASGYSAVVSARPVPGRVVTVLAKKTPASIVASWKRIGGASGYVVMRSVGDALHFKKVKTITYGKTVKFISTKLKRGQTYYFKVRAYKTVSGKKIYGKYSTVKFLAL